MEMYFSPFWDFGEKLSWTYPISNNFEYEPVFLQLETTTKWQLGDPAVFFRFKQLNSYDLFIKFNYVQLQRCLATLHILIYITSAGLSLLTPFLGPSMSIIPRGLIVTEKVGVKFCGGF